MTKFEQYRADYKKSLEDAGAIYEKATKEDRDLTPDEASDAKKFYDAANASELKAAECKEMADMQAEVHAKLTGLKETKRTFQMDGGDADPPEKRALGFDDQVKSLGERWTGDKDVESWLKGISTGGAVMRSQFNQSPALRIKGAETKALITGLSSTSAGAFVTNDRRPIVDAGTFYRPLTIRDLITVLETNSDVVEYVREGAHTNAAAAVAEATATGGITGAKPESNMVLSVVTENVKTIAHWLAATRRALSDAGQMRGLIDTFLKYGLAEELEDQMVGGDGVGENFIGIRNVSGVTAQAWDTDILKTTRKGRTKVFTTGKAQANGYGLHPTDWETIDLLQDNEARYYFGGPTVLGTPRLWGLPVAQSEAFTQGEGFVADWKKAVLWNREEANILVSDSHSDFFIRNMIAILAELRAAFGIIRPAAFVEMDLTA